jgi:hypothetical protein
MKRALILHRPAIFHYDANHNRVEGPPSGVSGDLSWVNGNLSVVSGDLSGVRGDLDNCEISEAERKRGVAIEDLITLVRS